jgi:hypothetical protein
MEPEPQQSPLTDQPIKAVVQELMKYGVLEAEQKPNLYRTALSAYDRIDAILEPLDLALRIDDVRGLCFLAIAEGYADSERDEWSHPLVRRQRLTLEQSLLVAILRRLYVAHEMETGVGTRHALVNLDELMPELNQFLGDKGSDNQNDKRLRQLLEQLRGHGLVSEIDKNEQLTIRPLIVHIANPENLQALLGAFRARTAASED